VLKKIPTRQAQLGMYIQSLEGPWLAHPFWKTKFVLREAADLDALIRSKVSAIWIDVSKGADVEAPAAGTVPVAVAAAPVAAAPVAPARPVPAARVSIGSELDRAAQVINGSRQKIISLFSEVRLGRAVELEECLPVVEEVAASVARNPSALISLARLKTQDDYTYMHSVAVCALMVALSRQFGMDEAQTREAGLAGLLHDVGKMLVPAAVLNKPGRLTDEEFAIIKHHPERGHDLLKSGHSAPDSALDVCLHHHEKMDGTGYPEKLKGDQISLLARMGAVCDVYDAITSNRAYKSAWDPAVSLQRMAQWEGHFDPPVFQAFVKSLGIYPVGSMVRLESGRMAVVVEQSNASLVSPLVRIFYSTKSKMPVPLELLDLSKPGVSDRIVAREQPREWGFTQVEELWRMGA
jgi:HD-GYP domain-containing protein (c-di-GMP phosphodiesterase class II)